MAVGAQADLGHSIDGPSARFALGPFFFGASRSRHQVMKEAANWRLGTGYLPAGCFIEGLE
jgi:hypothetical protein